MSEPEIGHHVAAMRRIVPNGCWQRGDGVDSPRLLYEAYAVVRDVGGTPLRAGDYLLKLWHSLTPKYQLAQIKRPWTRLPRAAYPALAQNLDSLLFVEGRTDLPVRHKLARLLRHHSAAHGKDETSQLLIVRPLVSPVSQPIVASTDEAALFELLAQVGGRMPADV